MKEIVFANGNTISINSNGDSISTTSQGERKGRRATGEEWTPTPMGVAKRTNAYTKEVQLTREDMLKITVDAAGTRIVECSDGTCCTSRQTPQGTTVTVESPGYASVIFTPTATSTTLPNETIITSNGTSLSSSIKSGPAIRYQEDGQVAVSPQGPGETDGLYSFNCINGIVYTIDNQKNCFRVQNL